MIGGRKRLGQYDRSVVRCLIREQVSRNRRIKIDQEPLVVLTKVDVARQIPVGAHCREAGRRDVGFCQEPSAKGQNRAADSYAGQIRKAGGCTPIECRELPGTIEPNEGQESAYVGRLKSRRKGMRFAYVDAASARHGPEEEAVVVDADPEVLERNRFTVRGRTGSDGKLAIVQLRARRYVERARVLRRIDELRAKCRAVAASSCSVAHAVNEIVTEERRKAPEALRRAVR